MGSTFSIFLIFILVYIIIAAIGAVLSIGGGGRAIGTILEIPVQAWTSVVIAYVYITHGPSGAAPPAPASVEPGWPERSPETGAVVSPGAPATAPPAAGAARFCAFCGAPLKPDARFCAACGRPV